MGVSPKTRLVLWTRAAGRCQYTGCNARLLGDLVSGKERLNKAYVAHVVAEDPNGPRGDVTLSPKLADDVENLMLLCDPHHRLIDVEAVQEHGVERLLGMKRSHEARIDLVAGIEESRASHVLLYAAKVGTHDGPVRYDLAKAAMLPGRYPAERDAIEIELAGCAFQDEQDEYWRYQIANLQRQFRSKVRERLSSGSISHLSVFALAPQPLLVELGRQLSDIPAVSVHQLHREPQDWRWREDREPVSFNVERACAGSNRRVGLVLSLSATVVSDRARVLLGQEAPIWTVTTPHPHNDLLHSAADLAELRRTFRAVLDGIKATHGQEAEIHVFPAAPVSAAVELGRVWMPKADLPLVIYDERRTSGGFRPRHRIGASSKSEMEVTRG